MYIALISLIILVCVLLALIVLAQNPKGGGLSSQFGAGGTAQLMGVKRTGDLLERLTWGFAIALMVLTLGTHMLGLQTSTGPVRSVNQQRALETRTPAAVPTPAPAPAGAPAGTQAPAQAPAAAPATTPAPASGN